MHDVGMIRPAGGLPREQGQQIQGQGSFLQHGVQGGRRRHFSSFSGDDAMPILTCSYGSGFIRADRQDGYLAGTWGESSSDMVAVPREESEHARIRAVHGHLEDAHGRGGGVYSGYPFVPSC